MPVFDCQIFTNESLSCTVVHPLAPRTWHSKPVATCASRDFFYSQFYHFNLSRMPHFKQLYPVSLHFPVEETPKSKFYRLHGIRHQPCIPPTGAALDWSSENAREWFLRAPREGEERKAESSAKGNGPVMHRVFSLGVCFPPLGRDAELGLGARARRVYLRVWPCCRLLSGVSW